MVTSNLSVITAPNAVTGLPVIKDLVHTPGWETLIPVLIGALGEIKTRLDTIDTPETGTLATLDDRVTALENA